MPRCFLTLSSAKRLRMGMNELGNLNDFKSADYPMTAVAVRRSFLAE